MKWCWFLLMFTLPVWGSPNREDAGPEGHRTFVEIKRHKRNYFIMGRPNTKARLSFRFPVKKDSGHYLAYSQTMIWELFTESSSPVTDVNFNPEYFYRFRLGDKSPILKEFDVGIEHLSNGGKYEESRSWNTVFADFPLMHQFQPTGQVFLSVKPFFLFANDKNNKDVRDYVGWYEFELAERDFLRRWLDYEELYVQVRPGGREGGRFSKGSVEVGLRFKVFPGGTAPHAFIQWFSGYGESQLRYKQVTHAIRIGFSI